MKSDSKNQRFCKTMKLSEVIKDFTANKYEVPIHEISIWIENVWKFDEVQNKMYKKGRESVNVQISKVN